MTLNRYLWRKLANANRRTKMASKKWARIGRYVTRCSRITRGAHSTVPWTKHKSATHSAGKLKIMTNGGKGQLMCMESEAD